MFTRHECGSGSSVLIDQIPAKLLVVVTFHRCFNNNVIAPTEDELQLHCKQELERFYSSPGLPVMKEGTSEFEDPRRWWLLKKSSFPTVWLLARFYLGIPATSANSERCFSFSNQLIGEKRTRMTTRLAADTFFVNRNFDLLPKSPEKGKVG